MPDNENFVKVTISMPKDRHRKLKAISALRGQGLSNYIMECVEAATFAKTIDTDHQANGALAEVEELAKN